MGWALWLLAPVLLTFLGALVLWARGHDGGCRPRLVDPVAEHRQLLHALAKVHPATELPMNLRVLAAPSDEVPGVGS